MTIEQNKFSTVRKAIEVSASKNAKAENRENIEKGDYDKAFEVYRYFKEFEPEKYEIILKASSATQEIREEMGPELFKQFEKIVTGVMELSQMRVSTEITKVSMHTSLNENKEELLTKVLAIQDGQLKKDMETAKSNPKLIEAFLGKEQLLNKGLEVVRSTNLMMMKIYFKPPTLRLLDDFPKRASNETEFKTKIESYLKKLADFFRRE